MAGPWEKYAQQPEQDGPWANYAQSPQSETMQPESPSEIASLGAGLGAEFGKIVLGGQKLIGKGLQSVDEAVNGRGVSSLVTGKHSGIVGRAGDWLVNDAESGQAKLTAENDPYAKAHPVLNAAGRIGTDLIVTAPVGGLISKAATKVLPAAAQSVPAVSNLLQAVRTSGMSAGPAAPGVIGLAKNMLTRSVGGAITGGASSGIVDPNQITEGAVIGGLLPPGLAVAGKIGSTVGRGLSTTTKNVLGLSTGVGSEPISQAFKAGRSGNQTFLKNMRGDVELTDVLDNAKAGLQAMNAAKNAEYRSGMIPIKGDKSVLSLDGISKAIDDASSVATYKGQVKNEAANNAIQKMRAIVDDWKSLDPQEFHTPEGLDALKQKLGGIMESIPFNEKSARLAANKVYNATKAEIESQAPTYAKVMKGYQSASDQITEIERALSLGSRSSKDTAMRKLQSLMRNNVQTNYGNRLNLANTLEQQGGVELLPALSGQALNSWTPRSLAGQAGAGATALMGLSNPSTWAALPLQSPRVVGEAAYGLGRLTGRSSGQAAPSGANLLNALVNDPSPLAQFGYRSAPVIAVGR